MTVNRNDDTSPDVITSAATDNTLATSVNGATTTGMNDSTNGLILPQV